MPTAERLELHPRFDNLEGAFEQTPGVYLRADQSLDDPHELDLLWPQSRPLHHREERQPVFFFAAGILLGALLTTLVFMLVINRPQTPVVQPEIVAVTANPLSRPAQPSATTPLMPNLPGQSASKPPVASLPSLSQSNAVTATSTSPVAGSQVYTVKSGDTLGSIAEQFYQNSGPAYVDKIQRANAMKNPDALQLGQQLTIPPKSY